MPASDEHAASPGGQGAPRPRYRLRPVTTPVPVRSDAGGSQQAAPAAATLGSGAGESRALREPAAGGSCTPETRDPFLRAATEDDDGYDPFSDRPPTPEPTFQEDPWG